MLELIRKIKLLLPAVIIAAFTLIGCAKPPVQEIADAEAALIDRDGHALGGFVNIDQQVGIGGLAKGYNRKQRYQHAGKTH